MTLKLTDWTVPMPHMLSFIADEGDGDAGGEDTGGHDDSDDRDTDDESEKPKLYTQEEVEKRIEEAVKKRLRRERRKQRQEPQPKDDEPAKRDSGDWRDAWDDALDELEVDLSRKAKRRLKEAFRREYADGSISDPAAWVEEYVEDFGIAEKKQEPKTEDDAPVTGKPKSDYGSSQPERGADIDSLKDPNSFTRDDIARLERKLGKHAAWRKIREVVEQWYRDRPLR